MLGALIAPVLSVPQPASAADSVSDNFNRANGNLGANWTDMTDGGLAISSQVVVGTNGAYSGDIRTGETYASDQSSQIEVTSTQLSGGQWIGAGVRAQNGGQSLYLGFYFWNNGNPELMLFKRISGNWTQLGASSFQGALGAGTQLNLSVSGSTLSFSQNGVVRITASDTSLTGGAPAVMAFGAPQGDNWVGVSGSSSAPTHAVGGTISGLSGTVVLENNGGNDLSTSANGGFAFSTQLAQGAAYNVTVKTNPSGQTCTVTNPSGTVATADVTNVSVTCVTQVAGSVSDNFNRANGSLGANWTDMTDGGLAISSQVVVGTNSAYSGDIRTGETYASDQSSQIEVTSTQLSGGQWIGAGVRAQNGGQSLYLGLYFWNNGNPELMLFKRISGNWTQLGASSFQGALGAGTQLNLSVSGSTLSFSQNGVVRITASDTSLTGGAPAVMAFGGPQGDNWVGVGTNSSAPTFSVGGTISGLSGTVVLENNGGNDLSTSANGGFAFSTQLAQGAAYNVTVKTNPSGQTCTVTNPSGTVAAANVTNVSVTCVTQTAPTFSVGGTISGLSGTVVLENNGGNDLSTSANGGFAFSTQLAQGAAYNVTVKTNPSGQTCTVTNPSGTVAAANVTNVSVACANLVAGFSPQYVSTDANNVETFSFTSANDGDGTQTLRVLPPTHPVAGVAHNFLYALPVESGLGNTFGDGIDTMLALDAQDQYNLTIIEPTFSIEPWYANNPNDANLQYETFMTKELVPWVQANLSTTGTEQNWLIGFSKSGIGAQDLIMKHPDLFQLAASWDFPADMSSYDEYIRSANNYGTDANFQASYRLNTAFVDAHKSPFLTKNRIWIGGYNAFQSDISDYDALLTSEGILHTMGPSQQIAHRWNSGWVPQALAALHQDSIQQHPPVIGTSSVSPTTVTAGSQITFTWHLTSEAGITATALDPMGPNNTEIWNCDTGDSGVLISGTANDGTYQQICTVPTTVVNGEWTTQIAAVDNDDQSVSDAGPSFLVIGGQAASTTVSPSVSPTSATVGHSVTYSATVASSGGIPTGTVSFADGGTALCTTGPLISGSGSCSATNAPAGSDAITATYSGDETYGSAIGTTTLTVTGGSDTVAFNSDAGAAVSSMSGPDGSSITLPSGTYPGYTFDGWFTASSGGTKVGAAGSSYTVPVGGITLHAQWTQNTVDTVAFNSEGGAAVASLSGPDGSSITLPSDTNPGHTFDGWFTASSGGTKVGAAGSSYTVPVGGITLHAQWTQNTVDTVAFNSEGGAAVASLSGPDGSSISLPSDTNPGYTFDGWFTASSGGTKVGAAGSSYTVPVGGITLYAQWTQNTPPPPPPPPPSPSHGYWLVGSDGGIFTFGSAQFHGSTGGLRLQRPVVGIVPTKDRGGYWLDASDGGVFAFGDAGFYGSIPGLGLHPAGSGLPNSLNAPIVGMVPSADGGGYFMVASDGGVFAFGDARFAGSCPGIGGCSGAAVAVMPDGSGNGYWVVTATGHVYTFGDAPYYGAPGPQGVPVTSAVRAPDGRGYWILFANGAISNFGDAPLFGSPVGLMGGLDPAAAIFTTSDGDGYWVAGANGAVASYGDAPNDGSMLGTRLNGSIIAATGW